MSTYGAHRQGTIYYLLGQRGGHPAIKIGITGDVHQRIRALGGGRVLAWHHGSGRDETRLHSQFTDQAIGGEWFRPSVALLSHIAHYPKGLPPPPVRRPPPSTEPDWGNL